VTKFGRGHSVPATRLLVDNRCAVIAALQRYRDIPYGIMWWRTEDKCRARVIECIYNSSDYKVTWCGRS